MSQYLKPWTVGQLVEGMKRDLAQCQTEFERINCRALCRMEIKDFVKNITRKLTPGEQAILDGMGIA